MKRGIKRSAALALALLLLLPLLASRGEAAEKVYFVAVNDRLLELNEETMPFVAGGSLYVSSLAFEERELGLNYARNKGAGLAILYTNKMDLRFDLENQATVDKNGTSYSSFAVEHNGYVFFPLSLVCRCFGLSWSYCENDTAPLIRIKSDSVILSDRDFVDAAAIQMERAYADYQNALQEEQEPPAPPRPDPSEELPPAVEGQRVYLVIDSRLPEDTKAVMEALGDVQATFLLTVEELEDGDLVRGLVAKGHSVALQAQGGTESEVGEELERARELLWQSSCSWLELVWYDGDAGIGPLLEELGCVRISAGLDWRDRRMDGPAQAARLIRAVGQFREDVAVCVGTDSGCAGGLPELLEGLADAQYTLSGWRLAG